MTRVMDFERIVYRCRRALRMKYQPGIVTQAEPLLENEVELIRNLGFEGTLVEVVDFGDQLHQRKLAYHVIGSGGSSIILFLLGISEVDPVRNHAHLERFWRTASGGTPRLLLVGLAESQDEWKQIPCPVCVTVHPMMGLEAIPALLEQQLGKVDLARADTSTFLSLQSGETEGVFQLESTEVQSLLSQIRPTQITEIATVTALDQIGHSHPEVVSQLLQMSADQSAGQLETNICIKRDCDRRRPLLYQEMIMKLLQMHAGLRWEEAYGFLLAAVKSRMTEQHELWKPALQRLEVRFGSKSSAYLHRLITASGWVVCRAHHAANAITS